MQRAQPIPRRKYTVADWEALPEQPKHELIDGDIYMMAQPSIAHIRASRELTVQLAAYLRGKRCEALQELAVQLNENEDTIFVPDVTVFCDPTKLKANRYVGAPDMVIEIISPSSVRIDTITKFNRYLRSGVREYWIVDADTRITLVNIIQNGRYVLQTYDCADKVKVAVLDDCEIDLSQVFPEAEE